MRGGDDRIRVLHVEDDPRFSETVAELLAREDERIEVERAPSAGDALARLDGDDGIDCIVSDYEMPGRNGIEFLEAVRESDAELPFILFTSRGSEAVASDAISAGVTDYLQKEPGTSQYAVLANRIANAVEQYRARREVERRERRFHALLERSPDRLSVVDADGVYRYVSPALARSTGYDPEELRGEPAFEYVHPDDRDRVRSRFERLLAEPDEIGTAEYRYRRKNGSWRWIESRVTNRLDDPAIEGIVINSRDVTERRERKRDLERYETIVEASGDPVYTLDAEGRLTFVNDAFRDVVGYDADDLLGKHVSVVMTGGDVARGRAAILELLATDERRRTLEMDLIDADGRRIPCEAHVAVLPFEEEFRGTTGIVRVIEERKRREEALRELHEATRTLIEAPDEEAVADRAVETARAVLDRPIGGVWLYDEADDALRPAAITDEGAELLGEAPTFTGEGSLSWRAFEDGELRIYDDLREEPGRWNPDTPIRSELIAPLGEHGVLTLGTIEAASFGDVDESIARILASTVEAALSRTRRGRRLERIQERTETLMTTTTVEETARIAVETAHDLLDAELSGFHRLTDDGGRLEPLAVTDEVRERFGEAPAYGRDDPDPAAEIVWAAFDDGDPLEIPDASEHEGLAGTTPAGSGIVYPVENQGVFIVSATEPRSFEGTDGALVDILGSTLATALRRVERESLLRERRRALERQNERLGEFASVVSHDLRNPLSVAKARVDLAREGDDGDGDGDDHLAAAGKAIDRMEALIEDLLALARAGETIDEVDAVEVGSLAGECWRTVETAGATLVVESDRTIRADEDRFRRLLENLFRNSIEHGPAGGEPRADDAVERGSTSSQPKADDAVERGSTSSQPKADDAVGVRAASDGAGAGVTVTVGDLADGTGLYVADDGRGIPSDERETVFERGYTTSRDGTGFGLSIVREIAEAHGWEVRAVGSEDGGVRFEITGVDPA